LRNRTTAPTTAAIVIIVRREPCVPTDRVRRPGRGS
jgi:hypothetical protein